MRFRDAASMLAAKHIGCIGLETFARFEVLPVETFVVANLYGQFYTYSGK
jgi:hypothetical protein